MILELRVENYAVIDQVAVEFGPGLNLLTGETGAGKSILIDALALLLGERASSDTIRHGAEKAVVAGVFDAASGLVRKTLEALGIDSDDDQLILRRELLPGGKGRVFINNQPATVGVLKQLAPALAFIHAQNESLASFDAAERRRLLDTYAGSRVSEVAEAFDTWKSLTDRIADLERDESDRLKLVDLWSFQKKEIEEAHLAAEEDVELEGEKRVLANSEKLYSAAMVAHELLYESQGAAASTLRTAQKHVEELARYDEKFREVAAQLESARITAEDTGSSLRSFAEGINASPERLNQIEDRLALLDRLKRKYGHTLDEVIAYGADVAGKLHEVENRDEVLIQLRKEVKAAGAAYLKLAKAVSEQRQASAKKLEKLVDAEINALAMKVRFKVVVETHEEEDSWSASGIDDATYLIATNAGEPLKPIEQIASGGEMSRVMLALKATIEGEGPTEGKASRGSRKGGQSTEARTLVFDEIDTGIGGRAAEAVGKKLKTLARANQVLCITHLAQIASFADQHYVIEKHEVAGRTKTRIRHLDEAERTQELARMISGAKVTETSLKHAEQMLKENG